MVLTRAGIQLARVGAAEIAQALAPMTGRLTRAEAYRLTMLLERMLASTTTDLLA